MYKVFDATKLGVRGSVFQLAPLIQKHGFEGIHCPADILNDKNKAEDALRAVQEYDLKWGLLPTPIDFFTETIEDIEFEKGLEILKAWAEIGEWLGIRYCYNHIWPSCELRSYDENFEWHVKCLERITAILKPHGILYGFEFLGPYELRGNKFPFIHTLAGILAIADAAGGDAGFLFDTYHWYCGNNVIDDIYLAAQNHHRMVCVHLNDGTKGIKKAEQRDLIRQMPMSTGIIDSAMIFSIFHDSGYIGPIMLEPMEPTCSRLASLPVEEVVIECAKVFKRVEENKMVMLPEMICIAAQKSLCN